MRRELVRETRGRRLRDRGPRVVPGMHTEDPGAQQNRETSCREVSPGSGLRGVGGRDAIEGSGAATGGDMTQQLVLSLFPGIGPLDRAS